MATDVFAGGQRFNGGFRADLLNISLGGQPIAGAMVQGMQYQFGQQLSMIHELGSNFCYLMGGRAQGNLNLNQIATAPRIQGLLLSSLRDLCKPTSIRLNSEAGCDLQGKTTPGDMFNFLDCVLQSIGGDTSAQSVLVTRNLGVMFINLQTDLA